MKKREFKKLTAEEQYRILKSTTVKLVTQYEQIIANAQNITKIHAECNGIGYQDVEITKFNSLKSKQINELLVQKHTDLDTALKQNKAMLREVGKLEEKMQSFLIAFFNLQILQKKGFKFVISIKPSEAHIYPYKGADVRSDKLHGHYGVLFNKKWVFIRGYGKNDVEQFGFKTYLKLKSAL